MKEKPCAIGFTNRSVESHGVYYQSIAELTSESVAIDVPHLNDSSVLASQMGRQEIYTHTLYLFSFLSIFLTCLMVEFLFHCIV